MNNTKHELDKIEFFHEKFQIIANKKLIKCAVSGMTRLEANELKFAKWTYQDLNNKANSLAAFLMNKFHVNPEGTVAGTSIVATYLGRTIDTVMANIAIHKAGAGFLNLSTLSKSEGRLQGVDYFLDCLTQPLSDGDSTQAPYRLACLLTTSDLWQDIQKELISRNIKLTLPIVLLDQTKAVVAEHRHVADIQYYQENSLVMDMQKKYQPIAIHPDTIAYIKFSSGTTGKPKGILIKHRGIMARIDSEVALFKQAGEEFEYSEKNLDQEHVIQLIDHSVDASFNEMILALAYGGQLAVVDEETIRDISKLWEFYQTQTISTTILVPNVWRKLTEYARTIEEGPPTLVNLKRIFTTGAGANSAVIHEWLDVEEPRICINAYGPTETTFGLSLCLIKKGDLPLLQYDNHNIVSIGLPMQGTRLLIVKRDVDGVDKDPTSFEVLAEILPNGKTTGEMNCEGELIAVDDNNAIAAIGVGYCNNSLKDKRVFIEIDKNYNIYRGNDRLGFAAINANPQVDRQRAYCTGDKACLVNGRLGVLNRYDRQIKINGRPPIDLDDLEALLNEAICHVLNLINPAEKSTVQSKIFYRHAVYQSLSDKTNKTDDHHLVAFILNECVLSDEDLKKIYQYMYKKLGSNIGIPSRWSTGCNLQSSDTAWKDDKVFIEKLWQNQVASSEKNQAGFRVIGQSVPVTGASHDVIFQAVVRLWKELLCADLNIEIDRDCQFEWLGGNSLLASEMLAKLEVAYGHIKPTNFYQLKTVASLVEDIKAALIQNSAELAVKMVKDCLNPVEGLPIYLVPPPMGTELDSYANFKQGIGHRLAFQLPTPGLSHDYLQSSDFTATARYQIDSLFDMKKHKRHKDYQPYILVGYSSGGIEAFEMAKQLTKRGFKAVVILIDSPCPLLAQQMDWPSYQSYIKDKFLEKTLKLKNAFKFKDASFVSSKALQNSNQSLLEMKISLVEEVREFLLKNSIETDEIAAKKQKSRINVSLNHLIAELNVNISEGLFPCLLITSQEFRDYFGRKLAYTDLNAAEAADRLGWPKACLTRWENSNGAAEDNPIAINHSKHFDLMQLPTVNLVSRYALEFIQYAERRIQVALDSQRLDNTITKIQAEHPLPQVNTQFRILAVTQQTEYCRKQFQHAVAQQNYNSDEFYPIYFDYSLANACLHSKKTLLDRYFTFLEHAEHGRGSLLERKSIKQSLRLKIFVDHIYDIPMLIQLHQALLDAGKAGYHIDSVCYTLDPHTYQQLINPSNAFQHLLELEHNADVYKPEQMVPGAVLAPISADLHETEIDSYIHYRYSLLVSQNSVFSDLPKEVLLPVVRRYTQNLASFLANSHPNVAISCDDISFALISNSTNDDFDNVLKQLSHQFALDNELLFIKAVRFCCYLENLGCSIQDIIEHPLYDQIKKTANSKLHHGAYSKLINEFFELGADNRHKLIISKFKERINNILSDTKHHHYIPFSQAWVDDLIVGAIAYLLNDYNKPNLAQYFIKNLTLIKSLLPEREQNAHSLIISLTARHQPSFEIFEKLPDSGVTDAIDLHGIKLIKKDGKQTIFDRVFHGISMADAKLENIVFENCIFIKMNFDNSHFLKCEFINCRFSECSLDSPQFVQCEFSRRQGNESTFKNCSLIDANFKGAKFSSITLEGCLLCFANLNNTSLKNCQFNHCDITGITLIDSKIKGDVKLNSYSTSPLSFQQFHQMSGKITLNVLLIAPQALYAFNNDSDRFEIINENQISVNANTSHLTPPFIHAMNKLRSSEILLSNENQTLTKGFTDLIRALRCGQAESKRYWLYSKADEFFAHLNETEQMVSQLESKLKIAQLNKHNSTKNRVKRAAQGIKSTISNIFKNRKITEPQQGKFSSLDQEIEHCQFQISQSSPLEIERAFKGKLLQSWKKEAEKYCDQPLFELTSFTGNINLADLDSFYHLSTLEFASLMQLQDEFFTLYCPDIRESAAYTNLLDALMASPCQHCSKNHCECKSKENSSRSIKLIIIKKTDLKKYHNGQIMSGNLIKFQLKAASSIAILAVKPNANHPYHAARSKLSLLSGYTDLKASFGKEFHHVALNELETLLSNYTKILRSSCTERSEYLHLILKFIEVHPELINAQGVKKVIEQEIRFLAMLNEIQFDSTEEKSCSPQVLLMAARSYRIKGEDTYQKSLSYYNTLRFSQFENEDHLKSERDEIIALIGKMPLPKPEAFSASTLSSGKESQQLAQAYYHTRDAAHKARLLQLYSKMGKLPNRLLLDSSGKRLNSFNALTNDYLVRWIAAQAVESTLNFITDESVELSSDELNYSVGDDEASNIETSQEEMQSEVGSRSTIMKMLSGKRRQHKSRAPIKYSYHSQPKFRELDERIELQWSSANLPYLTVTSVASPGDKVVIKQVNDPVKSILMMNFLQRLHGLVPDNQYIKLYPRKKLRGSDTQNLLLAEHLDPVVMPKTADEIRMEMGHYALTWKLFEICILGIKNKAYTHSLAVKKRGLVFSATSDQYYPAYSDIKICDNHNAIDWYQDCFLPLHDEKIDEFALYELKLLDAEEVIYGWLEDNENFEKSVLGIIHKKPTKIENWLSAFPTLEIELYQRLQQFRSWMLAQPPEALTYLSIWTAISAMDLNKPTIVPKTNVIAQRKQSFREQIKCNLQHRIDLERALNAGDEKAFDAHVDQVSDHGLIKILAEFDLVKLRLNHFEKILEKVLSSGQINLPLHNPSKAQIACLANSKKAENIIGLEITGCESEITINADQLPKLNSVVISDSPAITLNSTTKDVNLITKKSDAHIIESIENAVVPQSKYEYSPVSDIIEYKQDFYDIDVPGDNSCLFWSACLGYLLPMREDEAEFKRRFVQLFDDRTEKEFQHFKKLITEFHPQDSSIKLYQDDQAKNLVCVQFRKRVVLYMLKNPNQFIEFNDESQSYDEYIKKMYRLDTWGGELEIRAIQLMLGCNILTISGQENRYPHDFKSEPDIVLRHANYLREANGVRNHYRFITPKYAFTNKLTQLAVVEEPTLEFEPKSNLMILAPVVISDQAPRQYSYKLTCLSGDGHYLAQVNEDFLIITDLANNYRDHYSGKYNQFDQISMDEAGHHVLLLRHSLLLLIKLPSSDGKMTQIAALTDDSGFRSARLTARGDKIYYRINNKEYGPDCVYDTRSLLEEGKLDLAYVQTPTLPINETSTQYDLVATSQDDQYMAVIEADNNDLILTDLATSRVDIFKKIHTQFDLPIIKLELVRIKSFEVICTLTGTSFNMAVFDPTSAQLQPYLDFTPLSTLPLYGERWVDFAIANKGKGAVLLDNNQNIYWKALDQDKVVVTAKFQCETVSLSRSGHVVAVNDDSIQKLVFNKDERLVVSEVTPLSKFSFFALSTDDECSDGAHVYMNGVIIGILEDLLKNINDASAENALLLVSMELLKEKNIAMATKYFDAGLAIILELNININNTFFCKNAGFVTPLLYAALIGNEGALNRILDAGGDISTLSNDYGSNPDRKNALHLLLLNELISPAQKLACAKILLATKKIDINAKTTVSNQTAYSIVKDRLDHQNLLDYFLTLGADPLAHTQFQPPSSAPGCSSGRAIDGVD